MALYVSRYNGYQFAVSNGDTRPIEIDGHVRTVETEPEMAAIFRRKVLPYAALMQALQFFDSRGADSDGDPPGPIRHSHISHDEEFSEMAGAAAEPQFFYTAFDTDEDIDDDTYRRAARCNMTPEQVRAAYVAALDDPRRGDTGEAYIKIETVRVAAPWPNYDDVVTAQGVTTTRVAEKLVELARAFGADPATCVAYERENANREYVIAAFEAEITAAAEKRAEDEALSVP